MLAYGGIVALMYAMQRSLLYPGAAMGGSPPASAPWGEAISIGTADGERLYALHTPSDPGRPTVLFFHGNADFIGHYGFLAAALRSRGIGLLAVSYRGFRGSTGTPTEAGLLEDGRAAHAWLAGRTEGPVVLLGQSLGSGVAVHLAAGREVAGLILVSSYDSVLEVARSTYFFLPVAPLLKDTFRSDLRIAAVAAPKLFLHGRRDGIIPLEHGEALFALAPQPKRMLVLDAYGHNDIWAEGIVGEIIGFVEEVDSSREPE